MIQTIEEDGYTFRSLDMGGLIRICRFEASDGFEPLPDSDDPTALTKWLAHPIMQDYMVAVIQTVCQKAPHDLTATAIMALEPSACLDLYRKCLLHRFPSGEPKN